MEPGSQSQCRGGEIDVLRDQAGIDEVIGFLNSRIIQSWFLKSGVLEFIDIHNVD